MATSTTRLPVLATFNAMVKLMIMIMLLDVVMAAHSESDGGAASVTDISSRVRKEVDTGRATANSNSNSNSSAPEQGDARLRGHVRRRGDRARRRLDLYDAPKGYPPPLRNEFGSGSKEAVAFVAAKLDECSAMRLKALLFSAGAGRVSRGNQRTKT